MPIRYLLVQSVYKPTHNELSLLDLISLWKRNHNQIYGKHTAFNTSDGALATLIILLFESSI